MEEKKENFTYTYSAAQQEEIAAIRKNMRRIHAPQKWAKWSSFES